MGTTWLLGPRSWYCARSAGVAGRWPRGSPTSFSAAPLFATRIGGAGDNPRLSSRKPFGTGTPAAGCGRASSCLAGSSFKFRHVRSACRTRFVFQGCHSVRPPRTRGHHYIRERAWSRTQWRLYIVRARALPSPRQKRPKKTIRIRFY